LHSSDFALFVIQPSFFPTLALWSLHLRLLQLIHWLLFPQPLVQLPLLQLDPALIAFELQSAYFFPLLLLLLLHLPPISLLQLPVFQ